MLAKPVLPAMNTIPRPALFLGLAGLLPFLWGAASAISPSLASTGQQLLGQRLTGVPCLIAYGTVILCFMSGVLWGFAARARDPDAWGGYVLSVLPALWAFFMVGGGQDAALSALIVGFVALLAADHQLSAWGMTPRWWMRLRLGLTVVVVPCLVAGFYV